MGILSPAAPLMSILRAVVHQQQNASVGNRIYQQIEQVLSLGVDPVEVLEDDHQWLIEALSQEYAFNGLAGAAPPDLGLHLRQRVLTLTQSEKCQQVRQRVFQAAVKHQHLAAHFLAPPASVIDWLDSEIFVQQV